MLGCAWRLKLWVDYLHSNNMGVRWNIVFYIFVMLSAAFPRKFNKSLFAQGRLVMFAL